MGAILRRAFVLCAALISCAFAAGPASTDDVAKRFVAGAPDSATTDPFASNAATSPHQAARFPGPSRPTPVSFRDTGAIASLAVVVEPTSPDIGSKSTTTSQNDLNQADVVLSKGTQLPGLSDNLIATVKAKASASIANVPGRLAAFVENKGQWNTRARFRLHSDGKAIWLTDEGIVFDVQRAKDAKPATTKTAAAADASASAQQDRAEQPRLFHGAGGLTPFQNVPGPAPESSEYERLVFSEEFVGANGSLELEPIAPQPGAYNYLIGNDRSRWHTDVHGYGGVMYRNVWAGVDFKLIATGTNLEQEFIIRPGGDPASVQVAYRGIEGLSIADDGSLVVRTSFGELRETKPRIYQEIAGSRVPVDGRFKLTSNSTFTFEVKDYNEKYALVIDPTVLYSTFLGGSKPDFGFGIAVDNAGNAYVVGYTSSIDFLITPGAFQTTSAGLASFVTKLSPLGNSLIYSTYFGANDYYPASDLIAVDSAGEAYVAGTGANSSHPTTANAFQTTCSDSIFLTKLNAQGNGLVYSTCLGSGANSLYGGGAKALALDSAGRAYLTGLVFSPSNYPVTPNAYQTHSNSGDTAFVSVLDTSASGAASLIYSTYLGGLVGGANDFDRGLGIAVDSFGMVYVTGLAGPNFPVTQGAFQTNLSILSCSSGAAFAAKLNPTASGSASLIYSTFLTGSTGSQGAAIAVDSQGSAYLTGVPSSGNFGNCTPTFVPFPTTPGAFQGTSHSGTPDSFVTKVNAGGSGLVYSTLLGGEAPGGGQTIIAGIALNQSGEAYVAGNTASRFFPTTPDAFQPTYPGGGGGNGYNGFVSKLDAAGSSLIYSSYLGGGSSDEYAVGIAVDSAGDGYVAGTTYSFDFPTTQSAFQPLINNGIVCLDANRGHCPDAFVTKFPLGLLAGLSVTGILPNAGGNAGTATVTIVGSGFHNGATVKLTGGGGPDIVASPPTVGIEGRTMQTTFDLRGATIGSRNLVVTNPDGTSVTVASAYTIQQGGSPDIWLDLVGLSGLRYPGTQLYYLVYGNRGNIDSSSVRLWVSFDSFLTWSPVANQVPASQGQLNGRNYLAFDVSPPAGAAAFIPIALSPPNSQDAAFLIQAWEEIR